MIHCKECNCWHGNSKKNCIPETVAARAMASAFITKLDIYYSGLYAYQEAGGRVDDYDAKYTRILEKAAAIAIK